MTIEARPEDEDEDDDPPDLRRLGRADLLALADEPRETPHAKDAVLHEFRRRKSPAYRDLLLGLCVDPDVDPVFRLHLMRTGRQDDRPTSHAVWWLILNTGGGNFEQQEHHHHAVQLMDSADRDQSGEGQALLSILTNSRLPDRLRALAGADLMDVLGPDGLPLLVAHLGDDLVPMLEGAMDDSRASNLLSRIAERDGLDPDLRMEAAAACARDYNGHGEGLFADIATADGIDWVTRMEAVEHAVDAADSAAARAALDILNALLRACTDFDEEALSRHLAEVRDRG